MKESEPKTIKNKNVDTNAVASNEEKKVVSYKEIRDFAYKYIIDSSTIKELIQKTIDEKGNIKNGCRLFLSFFEKELENKFGKEIINKYIDGLFYELWYFKIRDYQEKLIDELVKKTPKEDLEKFILIQSILDTANEDIALTEPVDVVDLRIAKWQAGDEMVGADVFAADFNRADDAITPRLNCGHRGAMMDPNVSGAQKKRPSGEFPQRRFVRQSHFVRIVARQHSQPEDLPDAAMRCSSSLTALTSTCLQ